MARLITKATPDIGYLHRGDEKIAENMQYNQFVPYTDRLDYLAPLANNVAYACAVEKLMGWELPPRGKAIRVICCELARISAHLLGIGAMALDLGAMTVFLYTFTEREKIYNLFELSDRRAFHHFLHARRRPDSRSAGQSFIPQLTRFLDEFIPQLDEIDKLLTRNRIFVDRTRDVGVISKDARDCLRPLGSESARQRRRARSAPRTSVSRLRASMSSRSRSGASGDGYDRYLVRIEEMRQSVRILRQVIDKTAGRPDQRRRTGKTCSPPKARVMTKMEELIHHFIVVTEGLDAPPGEVYFAAENPKGELGFYINSKGGGVPHRLKIRAPSFAI